MDGLPIIARYKQLADMFDAIPDDKLLAHVWECGIGAVTGARSKLRKEGYGFVRYPTPSPTSMAIWVVDNRPLAETVVLQDEVSRLRRMLAEKEHQLAQLKEKP